MTTVICVCRVADYDDFRPQDGPATTEMHARSPLRTV